jgi:hypothetical protein
VADNVPDGAPQPGLEARVVQRLPYGLVLGFGQAARHIHLNVQFVD